MSGSSRFPTAARASLPAAAVILATGGVGQLYAVTTNPKVATADGWALAHRVGAVLRDIEFLQFHPTALKLPGVNPAPLISEAVRGAGATLLDRSGRRFALDHDSRGELAPRDVVARAVAAADLPAGRGSTPGPSRTSPPDFPESRRCWAAWGWIRRAICCRWRLRSTTRWEGSRPTSKAEPQSPASGPSVRSRGPGYMAPTGSRRTPCSKAWSLPIGWAARSLRRCAPPVPPVVKPSPGRPDTGADSECESIRQEMREVMTANVGLQRSESSLLHAEREIERLTLATPADAWRTHNQLLVAGLITQAARGRGRAAAVTAGPTIRHPRKREAV